MSQEQDLNGIFESGKEFVTKGMEYIVIPILKNTLETMLESLRMMTGDIANSPNDPNRPKIDAQELQKQKLEVELDDNKVKDLSDTISKYKIEHSFMKDDKGQMFLVYEKKDAEKMNVAVNEWSREALKNKNKNKNKEKTQEKEPLEPRIKRARAKMKEEAMKEQPRDKFKDMSR